MVLGLEPLPSIWGGRGCLLYLMAGMNKADRLSRNDAFITSLFVWLVGACLIQHNCIFFRSEIRDMKYL